ncbi:MAG: TerD family protein [Ruminococcus sp.]|nr:TerD family protein [Ruminococcus sp.]
MGFDIPMRTKSPLDRKSLANKQGLMCVRGSLDRNSLDKNSFKTNSTLPQSSQPVQSSQFATPLNQPVQASQFATPLNQPVQASQFAMPKKQRYSGKTGTILQKGQRISVGTGGNIKIALGWDILDSRCEIDASAFMLGADGKVLGDDWFIFYEQDRSLDGSVKYTKESTYDDAVIDIDFRKINPSVQRIVFSVTIYEAVEKSLNFGMTENVYARMTNFFGNEILRFELDECYSNVTAMILGELYRYKGAWKFNAVGSGVAKNLADFCRMYGVNLVN